MRYGPILALAIWPALALAGDQAVTIRFQGDGRPREVRVRKDV